VRRSGAVELRIDASVQDSICHDGRPGMIDSHRRIFLMAKPAKSPNIYRWVPGTGPDPVARARLIKNFPLPRKPMGEAWFLADVREMYDGLMVDDAATWPRDQLRDALEALASGPSCFGLLPEWNEWLCFLLPRVVDLIDDWTTSDSYETLVTAVMARYMDPAGGEPYAGFLQDVLATLGQCLLDEKVWQDGRIVPGKALCLIQETTSGRMIFPNDAFSASLFLVLKYLDAPLIEPWLVSVIAIKDPIWCARFVLWLAEIRPLMLEADKQLDVLDLESTFGVGWQWCWSLKGSAPSPSVDSSATIYPFLQTQRRMAFVASLRKNMSRSLFQSWRDELEHAEPKLGDLQAVIMQFDIATEIVASSYLS